MMAGIAIGASLVVIAGLAAALYAQWQRGRSLQVQLDASATELERLQYACARLAPSGVVQRLVADGVHADSEHDAELKEATALFVDLVGFSSLAERLDPVVMLDIVNGYYQRMSDAIDEHRGHVGSFVGDGIVAYFGAIAPNPWQCDDAVRAALAMRAAVREYNAELEQRGLPRIAIGVGIDRGPGLSGLVGSRDRKEYAFLGRSVNLAARIQALTRVHNVDILISEAIRAQVDPDLALTPMPAEFVKGFAEPVVTYAVHERASDVEVAAS